jgi:heme-degrading monooxygenase HmoA
MCRAQSQLGSEEMKHQRGGDRLKQPAIARIWRGRTRRDRADEYETYNYEAGIKPLIKTALAVQTFREDVENETEFVTISYWESIEAMREFTSSDPMEVHHLERDEEFLIELPKQVQILRLLKSHGLTYSGREESD